MPTPSPPNSIDTNHIREEANKTSWISKDSYPTPVITKIRPLEMINPSVDTNHQVGRNFGDGSVRISDFYDWNTWKKPTIKWVHSHQFAEEGGLRVAFRVEGGDIWRSGYVVKVSTTAFPSSIGTNGTWIRFGSEFNAGSSDLKYKYQGYFGSFDEEYMQVAEASLFNSYGAFGGYHANSDTPNQNTFPDITNPADGDWAVFSVIFPNFDNSDGNLYVSVFPIDGRQYHALQDAESDFNVSNNPTSGTDYENFNVGKKVDNTYPEGHYLFDTQSPGDGAVLLFDGIGGFSIINITDSGFQIDITNAYIHYLKGTSNLFYWVYVTDDLVDINHPYYPEDSVPSGHPYDSPTSDDFTTFELDKWVRFEGNPMQITGLAASTDYSVSVVNYRSEDLDRIERNGTLISAPPTDRTVYGNAKGTSPTSATTDSEPSEIVTSFTVDSRFGAEFTVSWDYDQANSSYQFQYAYDDDAFPAWNDNRALVKEGSEVNWDSGTNPKECVLMPEELWGSETEIRFRVRVSSSDPWVESGKFQL